MSAWGTTSVAVAEVATAAAPTASKFSFQQLMDEELAHTISHNDEQDDELALARAMQDSMENWSVTETDAQPPAAASDDAHDEDADLAFALKLQAEETAAAAQSTHTSSETASATASATVGVCSTEDEDMALAMQLHEEEIGAVQSEYEAKLEQSRQRMSGKVFLAPRSPPSATYSSTLSLADAAAIVEATSGVTVRLNDSSEEEEDEEEYYETETGNGEGSGGKPRGPFWAVRDKTLKGQGGDKEIVTKHDPEISGRRNVQNLSKHLSSRHATGDLDGMSTTRGAKLKVSNQVFNKLKRSLKKQEPAKGLGSTVEKDTRQTYAKGLDHNTRLTIHRMVNSGVLEEVHGAIRTGKEATVYHAFGTSEVVEDGVGVSPGVKKENRKVEATSTDLGERAPPTLREFAVKVFRTSLDGFKNRTQYIDGDHRFRSFGDRARQNPHKIVRVWAEKEFKNLVRLHRAGIPSPEPWRLENNVLLMEFLGTDGWPAPQLKETNLSPKRMWQCYVQVAMAMVVMFRECKIVHADLSEFNVLYHKSKCFIIDVGQAVQVQHPDAMVHLQRDCVNVSAFFRGVSGVLTPDCLRELITEANEVRRQRGVEEEDDSDDEDVHETGVEATHDDQEEEQHQQQEDNGVEAAVEATRDDQGEEQQEEDNAVLAYVKRDMAWASNQLRFAKRLGDLLAAVPTASS